VKTEFVAFASVVLLAVSCSPGERERSPESPSGSAPIAADSAGAAAPDPPPADEPATQAEPTPATPDEIAEICRVYRDALRSRWDDQRTREAVRGLSLTSDVASAWQQDLADGDADQALSASRSVVEAAAQEDLATPCEALLGLVAVAGSMRDVPATP